MIDNRNTLKKNQPELLVDFNGNAVQCAWMLGGKTIEVKSGNKFVCESTLMRICNLTDTAAHITFDAADYSSVPSSNSGDDQGVPILPGTCEVFGVYNVGQVYSVADSDIEVTFVYDRRTVLE